MAVRKECVFSLLGISESLLFCPTRGPSLGGGHLPIGLGDLEKISNCDFLLTDIAIAISFAI